MKIRQSLQIVLATAAVAVLAACGATDVADTETGSATAGSNYPVSIDTAFGAVAVDKEPVRVVAMGWGDAETALALGVQPVGASDWLAFGGDGVGPWAQGLYDESPTIIGTLEPSYEAVAALAPDLILDTKSSGDADRHSTLSAIAPTVGIPMGGDNYTTSYQDQVTMVAAALGVPDKGAELIDGLDAKFADAAAAHPEFAGKTVTVGAYSGTGFGAYIESSERVQFMERLGLAQNPTIESLTPVKFSVPISDEQLGLFDADLVVVFPVSTSADDVERNPLFQAIAAVRDGRYIVFDDPAVSKAYSTNSALSLGYAIDTVVPMVAKALQS